MHLVFRGIIAIYLILSGTFAATAQELRPRQVDANSGHLVTQEESEKSNGKAGARNTPAQNGYLRSG
jgi:hypothetical protein